ncbi:MAG: 3'(2'),5'-bisphosphate nucleotidase [Myxococcota bacterium]|nr:3'(2'),5'-bisphosphate nucleotidase [Myxococcota bacterium]MEC8423773.1 3'(2'),5'-bisphosphate nucleotidase [Myxococcota bacterium]
MSLARQRQIAIDAVIAASRVCQEVQASLVAGATLQKGDKSPVTVADFAAQAIVSHMLVDAFPSIPLVGEEDAEALREGRHAALKDRVVASVQAVLPALSESDVLGAIDRGTHAGGREGQHWTLDPIDGTKGFLRLDQYAVSLALIDRGEVVLGVLGCPNLPTGDDAADVGCVFIGVKGEGAFQRTLDDATEVPIRVADTPTPADARFCESVESAHTSQSDSAVVAEKLGITQPPFRIDSQCKYAAVARGDASIYLRLPTRPGYVEKIWDHAGGWAVITEAGGTVTDVRGAPLDFGLGRGLEANKGVIVTNGAFHAEVVAAVRAQLGL